MSFTTALMHGSSGGECSFSCPCKMTSTLALSVWSAALIGDLYTVADRLSKKPALLNQSDDHGYVALHYAAQNGHVSIVKYLLQRVEVDVNAQQCGATPLHRAGKSLFSFFVTISDPPKPQ